MKGPRQVLVLRPKAEAVGPFSALAQESANQDKQARGVAMRRFKVVYSALDQELDCRIIRRFFTHDRNPARIRARFKNNPSWGLKIHSITGVKR